MLLERSKAIIERIKVKSHNGTIQKVLAGACIDKPGLPTHRQVGGNVKKSWHFNINDKPDASQRAAAPKTPSTERIITSNQDIVNVKQSLKQLIQPQKVV